MMPQRICQTTDAFSETDDLSVFLVNTFMIKGIRHYMTLRLLKLPNSPMKCSILSSKVLFSCPYSKIWNSSPLIYYSVFLLLSHTLPKLMSSCHSPQLSTPKIPPEAKFRFRKKNCYFLQPHLRHSACDSRSGKYFLNFILWKIFHDVEGYSFKCSTCFSGTCFLQKENFTFLTAIWLLLG